MIDLFWENKSYLKAVNYIRKKLHLRCFTGFQIRLYNWFLYQCRGIATSSVSPGSSTSRKMSKNVVTFTEEILNGKLYFLQSVREDWNENC